MSCFESRISMRRYLLSALLGIIVGVTSAGAEVLVPFTPGNLLNPTVTPTVTNADGVYTYSYSITLDGSDPGKQQKAATFTLELNADVTPVATPDGWKFGQYRTQSLVSWACIEPESLGPGEEYEGAPPCRRGIAPDSPPVVFSLRSNYPPGSVWYTIQGDKSWPVATSEDDDLGPEVNSDVRVDSIRRQTTGPVGPNPTQTCSGAANGTSCDDGYFCNGPDHCSSGSCSLHDGNPCVGKDDGDADCAEDCDEDTNSCSRYDETGSPCPEDGYPCTVDECDLGECVHTPGNAGAVCSPQSGCQAEATCTGASIVCPSPANVPAGTACADDGNPCTVDQCNSSGTCLHAPGNAGAVCGATQNVCDAPATCTGTSTTCPANTFKPSTTVCRPSGGVCDVAESCTGTSTSCPSNVSASTNTICRPASGVCDVQEKCSGSGPLCPANSMAPTTTVCRASTAICDAQETCTGTSSACPVNTFASTSTVCRTAAGVCDAAEKCNGTSGVCPTDALLSSTTACRVSAGVCDAVENCTGTSTSCPNDQVAASTVICRAAQGTCDAAEMCTGLTTSCPSPNVVQCMSACPASPQTSVTCDEFQQAQIALDYPETDATKKRFQLTARTSFPVDIEALGTPQNDDTHLFLCLYEEVSDALISETIVNPGGTCLKGQGTTTPCWTSGERHVLYRDRTKNPTSGLNSVKLKLWHHGLKADVQGNGTYAHVSNLGPPLAATTGLSFQLVRTSGTQITKCWGGSMSDIRENDASAFSARIPK